MKRGPGTNEEQIASLRAKLDEKDIVEADNIVTAYNPDVIRLAYKLMRINETASKLPKSVTKLLGGLSKEDAELVRNKLETAKSVV